MKLHAQIPNGTKFFIVGFTDQVGDNASNKILAELRAKSVADRLDPGATVMPCGERQKPELNDADRINARKVEIWSR